MDSFHPGKKSIVFALLVAFLTTRNGRNLAAQILHKHFKTRLLFLVPLRVRCNIIKKILSMPPKKGEVLLSNATKPWGEQWDYLTRIQKDSWYGHWIVRNSFQQKKNKRVNWVESTVNEADLIIYYIHGGGFKMGDSTMYMESFVHIIEHLRKTRNLNVRIFSIDYGMIADVTYSRTKQDCIDAYRYLVQELGINPKKIIFAGDSAGGNLVATTLLTLRDMNSSELPLPLANVQISPWINTDCNQAPRPGKQYLDCLTFEMLGTLEHERYFLDKRNIQDKEEKKLILSDSKISPVNGSFIGFCPTLVTYGGTEIFQHDCEEFIQRLKRDNVKVDVITRSNAPHVWIISSILSPTHEIWKEDCTKLAEWCANQI